MRFVKSGGHRTAPAGDCDELVKLEQLIFPKTELVPGSGTARLMPLSRFPSIPAEFPACGRRKARWCGCPRAGLLSRRHGLSAGMALPGKAVAPNGEAQSYMPAPEVIRALPRSRFSSTAVSITSTTFRIRRSGDVSLHRAGYSKITRLIAMNRTVDTKV